MMTETNHNNLQGILRLLLDSLLLGGRAAFGKISGGCAIPGAAASSDLFEGEVGRNTERKGKRPMSTALNEQREVLDVKGQRFWRGAK